MKKNKLAIILASVFVLQLLVPFFMISSVRAVYKNGTEYKVQLAEYTYLEDNHMWLEVVGSYYNSRDFVCKYVPVNVNSSGFMALGEETDEKPEGEYILTRNYKGSFATEISVVEMVVSEERYMELVGIINQQLNEYKGIDAYVTVKVYKGRMAYEALYIQNELVCTF